MTPHLRLMVGEKGKANTSPVRIVFSTCKIRYELIKSTEMQWMYELWVEPKSQDFFNSKNNAASIDKLFFFVFSSPDKIECRLCDYILLLIN